MDPQPQLLFRARKLPHQLLRRLAELAIGDNQDVRVGPGAVREAVEAFRDGRVEVGAAVEDLFEEAEKAVDARGVLMFFFWVFRLDARKREREQRTKREE